MKALMHLARSTDVREVMRVSMTFPPIITAMKVAMKRPITDHALAAIINLSTQSPDNREELARLVGRRKLTPA